MATKSIKGSQTEKNLVISFLAESSANARYTFYAKQAEKEDYFPIQRVFEETAANELHHCKVFFKFLEGGQVTVPMDNVDAGVIGSTVENLATAAEEEKTEGYEFYLAAAKTAREEGYDDIAGHFEAIASVERTHRERFLMLIDQIKTGTVWKRDKPVTWKCLVCGYEYVGTEPPKVCPGCDHPYQHYVPLDPDILV